MSEVALLKVSALVLSPLSVSDKFPLKLQFLILKRQKIVTHCSNSLSFVCR